MSPSENLEGMTSSGSQESSRAAEACPEWAQNLIRAMHEQTARFQAWEQEKNAQPSTPITGEGSSDQPEPVDQYNSTTKKRRDLLPNPPEFDGKKSEFNPWLAQIYAKIKVDRNDESRVVRFWYIHSRLRGKALL
jgi:hypothetical protein